MGEFEVQASFLCEKLFSKETFPVDLSRKVILKKKIIVPAFQNRVCFILQCKLNDLRVV